VALSLAAYSGDWIHRSPPNVPPLVGPLSLAEHGPWSFEPSAPVAAQLPENLLTVSHEPDVKITHYGTRFNGGQLGCWGGPYTSEDISIIAVAPSRNKQWRCGMLMNVCGPGGCIVGVRQDTCPGCETNHLDLSEEGLDAVCGPDKGVCRASVSVYAVGCMIPEGIEAAREPVPAPESSRLRDALAAESLAHRSAELLYQASGAMSKSCRQPPP
jgi:hypothetical protein